MFGIIASIAGPLIGGMISGNATQSAADTQASATDRAAQIQSDATQKSIAEMARQYNLTRGDTLKQYSVTRADQAPSRVAGNNALYKLQDMMGLPVTAGGMSPNGPTGGQKSYDDIYQAILADADQQHQAAYGIPLMSSGDTVNLNAELGRLASQAKAQFDAQPGAAPNSAPPPAAAPGPDTGSLNKKFSISDFWNDPVVQASYQSGLDLGTKALKNAAPLTTGLDSGAALKELTKFGTDYTGNMAAGSQARFTGNQTNDYNRLMGIITGGQTANSINANAGAQTVGTLANAGSNASSGISGATMAGGNSIANLYSSLGNSNAAAKIAGANSWGNGLSSVSNFWNQQQMLNGMRMNNFNSGGYNVNPNSYSTNNSYGPEYP